MRTKKDLELDLIKQKAYFIGLLEGLHCGAKAGVDLTIVIEKQIKQLREQENV